MTACFVVPSCIRAGPHWSYSNRQDFDLPLERPYCWACYATQVTVAFGPLELICPQFLWTPFLQLRTFSFLDYSCQAENSPPISCEKVWLSLSWWNITLWRVKLDFYRANNRIGYACQHLAVRSNGKTNGQKRNTGIAVCSHRASLCASRIWHEGQMSALLLLTPKRAATFLLILFVYLNFQIVISVVA